MYRDTTNVIDDSAFGMFAGSAAVMPTYRWIVALLAIVIGTALGSSRATAQSTCPADFTTFTCPAEPPARLVIDHPQCIETNCVLHVIVIKAGGELRIPDQMQKADAKKISISASS